VHEIDTTLARRRYAGAIAADLDDPRVCSAFESVPREDFLGPGPWQILSESGYVVSASADPTIVYDDIVVALAPNKKINNGQPSLHALCLSAARIQPGEKVLHIGCGAGYYSAILSELVSASGAVVAWDLEPTLVSAAGRNLGRWTNVSVSLRDGTEPPFPKSDVIYVCAGCTQPFRAWIEALPVGGRLLFPLTPGWDFGGMLMVTRKANRLDAKFLCRCSFIPSIGGSMQENERALREAFARGDMEQVSELHFGEEEERPGIWADGHGWWLSRQ